MDNYSKKTTKTIKMVTKYQFSLIGPTKASQNKLMRNFLLKKSSPIQTIN